MEDAAHVSREFVQDPEEALQYHKNKLEMMWGPAVPAARLAEIKYKTPEDLSGWEKSCRSRAAYALGRASGDGFWEAKMEWYGTRANFIKRVLEEKTSGAPRTSSPPGLRSSTATFPAATMKRKWSPTVGGYPDSIQLRTVENGPTPNGQLTMSNGEQSMIGTVPPPETDPISRTSLHEEPSFIINEDN